MRGKDRTGLLGEEKVAEYLEGIGFRILERRWRTQAGELDLVALDGGDLVAVEVKTRRGVGYGHPFEAIDGKKVRRLHRLLIEYSAQTHRGTMRRRIDAVAVILHPGNVSAEPAAELEHLRDIS